MTSPPDFLQLHLQGSTPHNYTSAPPTGVTVAVYQAAIDTTMNYNCLQYDLALSVITQLPQHRAAKAPALLKWNHFRQEKANTQGNFVVQFVSVYVYVFNAYVYVYENKDESEYSHQLYLEP